MSASAILCAMSEERLAEKKTFTYEEALALLPEVRRITEEAYQAVEQVSGAPGSASASGRQSRERIDELVTAWARELLARGVEVKGLWLVDFDSGSGYYCWRYPEPGLQFYHSYDEGFRGRMRIQ
jgi:hypothetical protein